MLLKSFVFTHVFDTLVGEFSRQQLFNPFLKVLNIIYFNFKYLNIEKYKTHKSFYIS